MAGSFGVGYAGRSGRAGIVHLYPTHGSSRSDRSRENLINGVVPVRLGMWSSMLTRAISPELRPGERLQGVTRGRHSLIDNVSRPI
jgi:hypothetical protein